MCPCLKIVSRHPASSGAMQGQCTLPCTSTRHSTKKLARDRAPSVSYPGRLTLYDMSVLSLPLVSSNHLTSLEFTTGQAVGPATFCEGVLQRVRKDFNTLSRASKFAIWARTMGHTHCMSTKEFHYGGGGGCIKKGNGAFFNKAQYVLFSTHS